MSNIIYLPKTASGEIKLATGLKLKEYRCRCTFSHCTATPICPETMAAYNTFRIEVDVSLTIQCGYRCPVHNKDVGGGKCSRHLLGALDIAYITGLRQNFTPEEVKQIALDSGFRYILYYPDKSIFHMDTFDRSNIYGGYTL